MIIIKLALLVLLYWTNVLQYIQNIIKTTTPTQYKHITCGQTPRNVNKHSNNSNPNDRKFPTILITSCQIFSLIDKCNSST